jgi:CBS domain-containing protein
MSLNNSLFERIAENLKPYPPFLYLNREDLLKLSRMVRIKFHEQGELVFSEGDKRRPKFFVVNNGSVKVSSTTRSKNALNDVRKKGDILGVGHLLEAEGVYVNTAETCEDTILYTIPWEPFAELLPLYPDAVRYLKANIGLRSDLPIPALRGTVEMLPAEDLPETLVGRVEQTTELSKYATERFVNCEPGETMQEVAFKMLNEKAEAIVVVDGEGYPQGIVTKTDMAKAVQSGRHPQEAVAADFMSYPVITIDSNPRLGNCLRIMMKSGFQHLCLTEDGTSRSPAKGVISERDLMLYYGNNPMVIIRQIGEINSFRELNHMRARADKLILHELRSSSSLKWFSEILNELNRAFVKKVIRLAMDTLRKEGLYVPQASFCLFFAGAGGRAELFTRSPMDRGLVYVPDEEKDSEYCASFFEKLSVRISEGLLKCGWTHNEMGYTENNPLWCQPLEVWKSYFNDWIGNTDAKSIYDNLHWFDMSPAHGVEVLVDELRLAQHVRMDQNKRFVRHLSELILQNLPSHKAYAEFNSRDDHGDPVPFNLYKNVVEPIVNMVRLLALANQVKYETSTPGRLKKLEEVFEDKTELFDDVAEGFNFAMFVCTRTGLRDQSPGHLIDPGELDAIEVQLIKSTFRGVLDLRNFIEQQYLQETQEKS